MRSLIRFGKGFALAALLLAGVYGGLFVCALVAALLLGASEFATLIGLAVFACIAAGIINAWPMG